MDAKTIFCLHVILNSIYLCIDNSRSIWPWRALNPTRWFWYWLQVWCEFGFLY